MSRRRRPSTATTARGLTCAGGSRAERESSLLDVGCELEVTARADSQRGDGSLTVRGRAEDEAMKLDFEAGVFSPVPTAT